MFALGSEPQDCAATIATSGITSETLGRCHLRLIGAFLVLPPAISGQVPLHGRWPVLEVAGTRWLRGRMHAGQRKRPASRKRPVSPSQGPNLPLQSSQDTYTKDDPTRTSTLFVPPLTAAFRMSLERLMTYIARALPVHLTPALRSPWKPCASSD